MTSLRLGFFETVHYILQNLGKASLRAVREMLLQHSLDEADRMGSIKPDLLQKLRQQLKLITDSQQQALLQSQTTNKFNSTQTRIKSQSMAYSLNLAGLPKVKAPFLPAQRPEHDGRYTLVLDLDETLIHFVDLQSQGQESFFRIRPYCMQFLQELSKLYEVVIFTAGMQEYADWVLN